MNGKPPCRIECGKGGCFLEEKYDVRLNGKAVGQAQVRKEGLYYRFQCQCRLSGDVCKLEVSCGGKRVSLGVLVPMGDGFGLETKLPVKRIGEGNMEFCIIPNRSVLTGKFVPIYPEEPFAYIEKLKNAHLARQNGQTGVIIQETAGT